MRNTYKYTQLYSGQSPLFEEGNIFRTFIPLKRIATQKVGGLSVPQSVPQNRNELIDFIKEKIKENNKITRKAIAEDAGVSIKTVQRALKKIDNLKYIGRGNNGYWEFTDERKIN